MDKVKRVRPYDYRRDGAIGKAGGSPQPGGIFGQRISPANHTGIFEAEWALPFYVEESELVGGKLSPDKLKADVTTADPVERKIKVPDLGVEADNWRMPWPKQPVQGKRRVLVKKPVRRFIPRKLALGADPVAVPASEPTAVVAPAPQRDSLVGPIVLLLLGIAGAKLVFSK